MGPAVVMEGVVKEYEGGVRALDGVSLEIARGEASYTNRRFCYWTSQAAVHRARDGWIATASLWPQENVGDGGGM